jgi:hypothetical protein
MRAARLYLHARMRLVIAHPRLSELFPARSQRFSSYPARRMHPLPRAKGRSVDDGLVIMTADGTELHAH